MKHLKRQSILWLLLLVTIVGCRHKSVPNLLDGGVSTSTLPKSIVVDALARGAASPNLPVGDRFAMMRELAERRKTAMEALEQKIAARHPAPPDPRVENCKKKATDRDTLMSCLNELSNGWGATAPDASVSDAGGRLRAVRPLPRCPALLVSPWYIASTGNNANTCTDAGHPCADVMEIESRWGCGGSANEMPWINSAVQIISLDNMVAAQDFALHPHIAEDGTLDITCNLTQLATGSTLSGVVPKNNLASQALNANLGAGVNGYVGKLIHNTTHDSWAIVDSIVSGNVALITQPFATGTDNELDMWGNGDGYTIQQPNTLYMHTFVPTCGTNFGQSFFPINCNRAATIHNCSWPAISHVAGAFWNLTIQYVDVYNSLILGISNLKSDTLHNSEISVAPQVFQNSVLIGGSANQLFSTGAAEQFGPYIGSDAILHGSFYIPPMALLSVDAIWGDPGAAWFIQGQGYPSHMTSAPSTVPYVVSKTSPGGAAMTFATQFDGLWAYNGGTPSKASQSFGAGVTLQTDLGTSALCADFSQPKVDFVLRTLTPANLDVPADQGGCDGRWALGSTLNHGFLNWGAPALPIRPYAAAPYVAIAPATPGLVTWVRGDYVTVSSGAVTYARDESGNGYNYTRPTGTGATLTTFATTNAPAIHFGGAGGLTPSTGASVLGLGDHSTVFIVMRSSGGGAGANAWSNGNVQFLDNVPGVGTHWGTFVGNYLDSNVNVDDGNPHVLALRIHSVANIDLITDGALVNRTTGTAYQNVGVSGLAGSNNWTGDIAEIRAFNVDLTDQQVDAEDMYLSSRYGLAMTRLPAGPTGGDLCATHSNPAVCGLQNVQISSTVATPAQIYQLLPAMPAQISTGLQVYVDSDLGVTTVSGNVSAWLDRSNNAYNFTQATVGNRPVYTASGGAGGHGYLTYAGANNALAATVASIPESFDAFVIADKTGDGYMYDFGSNQHQCQITGGGKFQCYNSGVSSPQITASNALHVYEAQWSGANTVLGFDGTQTAVTGVASSPTGTTLTIGNYGGGSNGWTGRYYALVIYDHRLSTAERNRFCGFAVARWGATCAGSVNAYAWAPVTYSGHGTATLTGTTAVTISYPTLTNTSVVQVTARTISGTAGHISAPNAGRIPGASFTIVSDNAADTSTVDWFVAN